MRSTGNGFGTERKRIANPPYSLRLRHEQPKQFDRFWKRCCAKSTGEVDAKHLFREMFPRFREKLPVCREGIGYNGEPDDAQIMDEPLFQQLKEGFSETVNHGSAQAA